MNKNIYIEIYKEGSDKIGYICSSISEARNFLSNRIRKQYIDCLIFSLETQLTDLNKFPNIIIFLNKKGKPLSLNRKLLLKFKILKIIRLLIKWAKNYLSEK